MENRSKLETTIAERLGLTLDPAKPKVDIEFSKDAAEDRGEDE